MSEDFISVPSFLNDKQEKIQLCDFLTNTSPITRIATTYCTTIYQTCGACELNTQCGTCQHICQTLYQTCGACETSTQCGTCQHVTQCDACQTTSQCSACETTSQCGTCQTSQCNSCEGGNTQCGTCQSCQGCEGYCEIFCQGSNACQTECQSMCEKGCLTCESSCQTVCEINGQGCSTTCESSCQTSCQNACQDTFELCGVACQFSCESACQFGCQATCETQCQTSCMTGSGCQDGNCQSACQVCEGGCQLCEICESSCERICEANCEASCQNLCELECQGGQVAGGGGGVSSAFLNITEISPLNGGSFKAIINNLSKPFSSANYKGAYLTTTDCGSPTASISNIIKIVSPPSSSNNLYAEFYVSNVGFGIFNIYAYCLTNAYYKAGHQSIKIDTTPDAWTWSNLVQSAINGRGRFDTLRTYEWNDFLERILTFLKFKERDTVIITSSQQSSNNLILYGSNATASQLLMEAKSYSSNNILTAEKFNTVRYIIDLMNSTGISTVYKNNIVYGSYFNTLKDTLNLIK